ncbi:hypothetical protein [Saccharothrix sp. HUAS TT1]|uniref:DUF6895 family protein n=1 Tax=unclassified Saccharothrix TaxID=2593673 RepID=UPI00345C4EA8
MTATLPRTAHDLIAGALGWLHAHHELDVFPADTTADLDDPDSIYRPLAETALSAALVLRAGVAGTVELRLARELLEFSWRQMRDGDLLYERQLRHPLLTDPVETYMHYHRSGIRHDALDEVIAHNSAVDSMTELVPNRRLAIANAHRVLGVPRDDDWASMARQTWLGGTPQPWAIDWDTAYHMTHTVFHLTDWGARPTGLPPDLADYLAEWLPVWVDIWAEVRHWDLVGELLIVGACLPEPRCDEAEWRLLAQAQHADGLVPRDGDPVPEERERRYRENQHTAVVAVVAGTIALSRLLGGGT